MLIVHLWDEICGEWSRSELDLPPDTRDPQAINRAVNNEDDEDGWTVKSHSTTGPILTIVARSDRNHLGIILVNAEEQDKA